MVRFIAALIAEISKALIAAAAIAGMITGGVANAYSGDFPYMSPGFIEGRLNVRSGIKLPDWVRFAREEKLIPLYQMLKEGRKWEVRGLILGYGIGTEGGNGAYLPKEAYKEIEFWRIAQKNDTVWETFDDAFKQYRYRLKKEAPETYYFVIGLRNNSHVDYLTSAQIMSGKRTEDAAKIITRMNPPQFQKYISSLLKDMDLGTFQRSRAPLARLSGYFRANKKIPFSEAIRAEVKKLKNSKFSSFYLR